MVPLPVESWWLKYLEKSSGNSFILEKFYKCLILLLS